jgi:hypothetical protein
LRTGPVGIHRHISLFSPNNIELLPKGWKVSNTYGTMDPICSYWMSEMEQKNHMG